MAVLVNILTTYSGAGNKRAMRDLALLQRQARMAGSSMSASMLAASASMRRAGTSIAATGASLSKYVTLPIVAVGAVSAVAAAKFDDSMNLIRTQAGGSAKDVEYLKEKVLELGAEGQHGPAELSDALYHLKSVGLGNAKAMAALTASERLASVGHADLEATTNAVAGAYKSGIEGARSFGGAVGTLNAIIGAGNMRMEDLNAALGTGFLVNAQQFGVSLESVGSALAMMTSRGIPATRSAMALKMAFAGIAAPSAKAEKIMSDLGLSSKDLAQTMREGGLQPAMQKIADSLKGMSKTEATQKLTQMFGAKSSQAILTLLGNLKDYDKTLKQVHGNAGKFDAAAAAQAKETTAKWAKFKSTMSTVAIQIGDVLLPALTQIATAIVKMARSFSRLDPRLRDNIVKYGLIAAAIGPVLVVFGKMMILGGRVFGVMGKLGMAFGKGAAAAPRYARAFAAVVKGAGRMVVALGRAVVAAVRWAAQQVAALARAGAAWAAHAAKQASYSLMGIRMMVRDAATKAAIWAKETALAAASAARTAAAWVVETAAKAASTAATIAHSVATKAAAAGQWLLNAAMTANPIGLVVAAIVLLVAGIVLLWKKNETFRRIVIGSWNAIKAAAVAVFDWLVGAFRKWGKYILVAVTGPVGLLVVLTIKYWSQIKGAALKAWSAIRAAAAKVWAGIKAIVSLAWRGLVFYLKNLNPVGFVVSHWDRIKAATGAAWAWIKDKVTGVWSGIADALKRGVSAYLNIGTSIVEGLWNGFKKAWGDYMVDKLGGLVRALPGWVKKILGIHSPSKVFAEIGRQTAAGMALGITQGADAVRNAALALAGAPEAAFGAPGGLGVPARGGRGAGGVLVAAGAVQVQVNLGGASQASRSEIRTDVQRVVDDSLRRLAREIMAG